MSLSNSLNINYLHSSLLHHSVPLVDLGGAAEMFVLSQSNLFHFHAVVGTPCLGNHLDQCNSNVKVFMSLNFHAHFYVKNVIASFANNTIYYNISAVTDSTTAITLSL